MSQDKGKSTYKLKYPFESVVSKELVSEITLIRPKAKHIRKLNSENDNEKGLDLLSKLSGLTPIEIGELDLFDLNKLNGIIEGFLEDGQTGNA